jgi:NTP pyrophosphatase (non-canonical NTP hydrolase)
MLLNDIAKSINEEMDCAKAKFPDWPEDLIHAAAIVGEEAGELLQATLQNHYEGGSLAKVQKEAIHTATMAIRFLENLST